MPRQARIKGEFSIYHITQRGNEKKNLFLCDEDKAKFIEILGRVKAKYSFLLYTFCLMDNHVHLLIDDNGNDISKIIKSLNISYVQYFNRKYQRCGHLFQDRFRSELVKDERYLLQVSRYIHNNPVRAGMVKELAEYCWSSYNIYAGRMKDLYKLVDKGRLLSIFSANPEIALQQYLEFMHSEESSQESFLDYDQDLDGVNNSDFISSMEQARLRIRQALAKENIPDEELNNNIQFRNDLMKQIRRNSSLTLKEIGELFGGISESRVSRILGKAN
ncbi:MAG: REP-associated tyrosine transposase [Bacillota bacterium]